MRRDNFDSHPHRDFELNDYMLGPDPLLAAWEADQALERDNQCTMGNLPAGMVWLPAGKARWYATKQRSLRLGAHLFWSMQVNQWIKKQTN